MALIIPIIFIAVFIFAVIKKVNVYDSPASFRKSTSSYSISLVQPNHLSCQPVGK